MAIDTIADVVERKRPDDAPDAGVPWKTHRAEYRIRATRHSGGSQRGGTEEVTE